MTNPEWQKTFSGRPLKLGGYDFDFLAWIQPALSADGSVAIFDFDVRPDQRHRHGAGPFCQFKVPAPKTSGLYLIVAHETPVYVGRAANLKQRWHGYGRISPYNVRLKGRQTNCRINATILRDIRAGVDVSVWFRATPDFVAEEAELLEHGLAWNLT